MTRLTLFGTVTSPYVRRVRIVAHELGIDVELIDTSTEAGQAALRAETPLWKIPVARIEGVTVFDSAAISAHLMRQFGPGSLRSENDSSVAARNFTTVTDGAVDALINAFYLAKDGVLPAQAPYVEKQMARAASAMAWLDARLAEAESGAQHFGLPEIALYTSVDWMRFRSVYDVAVHPAITRFMGAHADRESVKATRPPA